ncbi:MAG: hypothetical protein DMG83_19645 [Acidobacteria bacterium]|nr:MAG: hypothetical protein DMG83_19645 [Acidobacteriota bacterium]
MKAEPFHATDLSELLPSLLFRKSPPGTRGHSRAVLAQIPPPRGVGMTRTQERTQERTHKNERGRAELDATLV